MSALRALTYACVLTICLGPSTPLFAQGAPISGSAHLTLSAQPNQLTTGNNFTVQLGVDLTGVTGADPAGARTAAVLGGYQISIAFDSSRVQLVSVSGSSGFPGSPTSTNVATANANGSVLIAASQTSSTGPTGAISVASIIFKAVGTGTATLTVNPDSLSSAFQTNGSSSAGPAAIPGTSGNTAVTVGAVPGPVVLISPADGASSVDQPVTLTWSGGSGFDSFDVYFGTSSDPDFVRSVTGTSTTVNALPGTTYFWRIVAKNAFGQTSSSTFSFQTSGTAPCPTPSSPIASISKTDVASGESFTISWTTSRDATEYRLEESVNADFSSPVQVAATGLAATLSRTPSIDSRYYYRVSGRGKAGSCDLIGSPSNIVSVLVHAPVSTSETFYIPVIGSTPGNLGSFFKTAVQLHNPSATIIKGTITYHAQGTTGLPSDPSLPYTLQPGETIAFTDLLPALGQAGLGSADLVTAEGRAPLAVIRIFNDAGASGTTGMTETLVPVAGALKSGDTAALIAPPDTTAARFNIGVRSLASGATMTVVQKDKSGAVKRTLTKTYAPNFFAQVTSAAFLGGDIAASDTIALTITAGQAIVYGATTDNQTQDPSLQFAAK